MGTASSDVTCLFLKCVQLRSALRASFIHLFHECTRSHWALFWEQPETFSPETTTHEAPVLEELSLP